MTDLGVDYCPTCRRNRTIVDRDVEEVATGGGFTFTRYTQVSWMRFDCGHTIQWDGPTHSVADPGV